MDSRLVADDCVSLADDYISLADDCVSLADIDVPEYVRDSSQCSYGAAELLSASYATHCQAYLALDRHIEQLDDLIGAYWPRPCHAGWCLALFTPHRDRIRALRRALRLRRTVEMLACLQEIAQAISVRQHVSDRQRQSFQFESRISSVPRSNVAHRRSNSVEQASTEQASTEQASTEQAPASTEPARIEPVEQSRVEAVIERPSRQREEQSGGKPEHGSIVKRLQLCPVRDPATSRLYYRPCQRQ